MLYYILGIILGIIIGTIYCVICIILLPIKWVIVANMVLIGFSVYKLTKK